VSALEAWVLSALLSLPVPLDDRAPERAELRAEQLRRFAGAISRVSAAAPAQYRGKQWAALLVTIGNYESHYDSQVVLGLCPKHRCDPVVVKGERIHRARGAFQQWNTAPVADLWPVANGNPAAQVEMADRTLRRSLTRCRPFASFPEHVFRAYGGRSCSFPVKREAARVATFRRLAGAR
jgi:hypothetical protein